MRTFSSMFMLAPGDCSPSLRVVSKMFTMFLEPMVFLLKKRNSRWRPGGSFGDAS